MSIQLPQEPALRIKWEEAQRCLGLYAEKLQLSVWLAVPLEIDAVRRNGGPHRYGIEWLRGYTSELIAKGDNLQFQSKKCGGLAALFQHFVYALALLSFAPGGVQFAGMHFVGHRLEEELAP